MTAVDPSPRALPEIGLGRAAMLVKTGWHVYYAHAWRLVLDARRRGYDKGPVLLTLHDGLHDRVTANLKPGETLMSRTPEEQIQFIEASRSSARGGGSGVAARLGRRDEGAAGRPAALPQVRRPDRMGGQGMRVITHKQGAELLFAAEVVPPHPENAVERILEQFKAHGGDPRHFADEMAVEYARHPETAAAHMLRCLDAFEGDIVVPDWPERGQDGHLYTGLGDDDLDD